MASVISQDEFFLHFPNYILVAGRFKENKAKGVNILHNVSIEEANSMNTIKDKRDIYFTPNGDFKNIFKDSKANSGRSEKQVIETGGNIYCFLGDNDGGETLRKDTGLTPTIINKTKRGYHMFFIFKNPVEYKTYANRWKATQQQLKELLKVDPADIPRILRAPGFKYYSDNLGEVTIETIEYNKEEIYTFEQREERIDNLYNNMCSDALAKDKLKKQFKKSKTFGTLIDLAFSDIGNRLYAYDVLSDLYPKFQLGTGGNITENGQRTKGYMYKPGLNYVNNFSTDDRTERPAGGPWVIAANFHKSLDLTLEYFKTRWNVKIDDMRQAIGSQKEIVFTEIASEEETQTTDSVEIKVTKKVWNFGNNLGGITIDQKKMEIRGYTSETNDISFINALITPIGYIMSDKHTKTFVVGMQKLGDMQHVTIIPNCSNLKEFRKFMMNYGIMISEKREPYYVYLYDYIYKSTVPEYFYTNKLGLQELGGNMVVIEKTGEYLDEDKRIFVQILDTQDDVIKIVDVPETFQDYMAKIIGGYGGRISVPIALTMMLGVNAYHFRKNGMQLPQMFVFGLSQCGKTTMLNNIFRSFGINKDISAGSKAFVYEKYARHYIPTHFSEYRNSAHKQSETIEGFMRNLFDGSAIEKGRADQTTVKYEANGLYIFDGQTIFTDDAVLTRMVILMANNTDKLDLKNLKTLPNIYKKTSEIFMKQGAFEKFMKLVEPAFADIKKRITFTRSNDRMIQNYSYLYALCDFLGLVEYKKYLDAAMSAQDGMTAQDDIQMIYSKVFNMQYVYKFPCEIYHKGILISASEEGIRFNANIEDLKGFVKTINTNFLGTNTLGGLKLYVDLQYIYDHPGIRGEFFRALHTMYSLEEKNNFTADERKTIGSLREFLLKNKPDHRLANDLNADLFDKGQPGKPTSVSNEIDFD